MECEVCRDKLADFLLDELPESEAVLVQEHLALCQTCQATYKQLKGTGRALEAVPAMRPVKPSPNFSSKVMRAARVESEKILRELPVERRIRLQKRRQVKQRRQPSSASPGPKAAPWRGALLLLFAGAVALTAILRYYSRSGPAETVPLGTLRAWAGRVEQFRPKAGTQLRPVKADQGLRSGDEFVCDEAGRARFDLDGNGAVLLGPLARIRFLNTSRERAPRLRLLKGELGVERGARLSDVADWAVVCDRWQIRVTAETRLFLKMGPDAAAAAPPVLSVLAGVAHVGLAGREGEVAVTTGRIATLSGDEPSLERGATLPDWRADLCTEKELAEMVAGISQVVGRNAQGLLVELQYGFGRTSLGDDWRPEKGSSTLAVNGGVLQVPNGSHFLLKSPLAAPLEVEATVSANVPKNCPWGLAFQCGEKKRLALDLDKEAVLNVHAKPVPRVARVGYRTSTQAAERVRLTVSAQQEGEAVLSTSAGKTPALPVPKKLLTAGTLRVEALGEGLTLDGLRIKGVLPREWVLKQLTAGKH